MSAAAVNMKTTVINNVICVIANAVTADILNQIDFILHRELYNCDVTQKETDIVVYDDSNNKMLKIFAANKKLENIKEGSIRQYVRFAQRLFDFTGKSYKDIETDDIKMFLAEYSIGKKPASVDNARRFISAVFTWLHDCGHIQKNPMRGVRSIKADPPKKEVLTDEEIEQMRDSAESIREIAIVDLLTSTGVRVGELEALNIDDVDFLRGQITFKGEKSGRYRTVYLNAKAKKHLIDYINTRTDHNPALFVNIRNIKKTQEPGRMKRGSFQAILKRIAKKAGIKKHVTVHIFRRTLATMLHRAGVKLEFISEIMGHASTATTEIHYVSKMAADIRQAFDRAFAAA